MLSGYGIYIRKSINQLIAKTIIIMSEKKVTYEVRQEINAFKAEHQWTVYEVIEEQVCDIEGNPMYNDDGKLLIQKLPKKPVKTFDSEKEAEEHLEKILELQNVVRLYSPTKSGVKVDLDGIRKQWNEVPVVGHKKPTDLELENIRHQNRMKEIEAEKEAKIEILKAKFTLQEVNY